MKVYFRPRRSIDKKEREKLPNYIKTPKN